MKKWMKWLMGIIGCIVVIVLIITVIDLSIKNALLAARPIQTIPSPTPQTALVVPPQTAPQSTQPTQQSSPPATYQNIVARGEILTVLRLSFPSVASPSVSREAYRLYTVDQFLNFMHQEYANGAYVRFGTINSAVKDSCGAADSLILSANTKLSGIPVGRATMSDKSRTYFISVFWVENSLKVKSFAPIDGQLLPNDPRMQITEIR